MIQPTRAVWEPEIGVFIANNRKAKFTRTERKIVDALWARRGLPAIPSQREFSRIVYGDHFEISGNTIAVHLIRIRKRLEPCGYMITQNQTRPRMGFKLVPIERSK